jgi:hypothetical protein
MRNIETSCSKISADENIVLAIPKERIVLQSCIFLQLTVKRKHFDALTFQKVLKLVQTFDCAAEDKSFDLSALKEHIEQGLMLV